MKLKAKNVLSHLINISDGNKQLKIKKELSLIMLSDLLLACKKNDIYISVTFGTLLGAIRHKGFIPWDDDIDLCAYYNDFGKIISAVKKEFPGKYFFAGCSQGEHFDPFYGLKMMLVGTKEIEYQSYNFPYLHGISIDVFPLIKTYKNSILRFFHKINIKLLIHKISLGYEHNYPPYHGLKLDKKTLKYFKFRHLIGYFFHLSILRNQKKLLKLYDLNLNYDCFLIDGMMNSKTKYFFTDKQISNLETYDFEYLKVPGFKDFKFALEAFYGTDYMNIPSKDKQENHSYYLLDFGKYNL